MDNKNWFQGVSVGSADCRKCSIKDIVLFASIQHDQLDPLHPLIDDLHFAQYQSIYQRGQDDAFVYTIRKGIVKLVATSGNTHKVVRLLTVGDVVGLECLSGKAYEHTAITLDNCEICRIPAKAVLELQQSNPALCTELLNRWSKAVKAADDWLVKLHTGQARERVLNLLRYLVENSSIAPKFILPGGDDIASILSLRKETVSREIAEMKREGLLVKVDENGIEYLFFQK